MTRSRLSIRALVSRCVASLALLALAAQTQAQTSTRAQTPEGWTLVRATSPVTTIHETVRYLAPAGRRLAVNDIVETAPAGGAQLQDADGNVLALGPDTRVLLARGAQVALLRGWLKLLSACDGAAGCAPPAVETERTRFAPVARGALVIAAAPPGYDADAAFCESGAASVDALGQVLGRPAHARLDAPRFAQRASTNRTIAVLPGPDPAFVAAMPTAFRDALRALPVPPAPHDAPPASRPVAYDDVADWLTSTLAVRTAAPTRFAGRFRPRLSDAAFRRDVRQHLGALPDWRALLFPPPRRAPSRASSGAPLAPPAAYPSIPVRP
ncbi:hypothetical protein [Burkholderia plantarii]|uniref:hypothetical protein n=1 Tax=Burkholderia plantarii TaxID=41899 RepID=UPI000706D034|nr:hypothetical protein [Burkholderia plantarii]ALK32591.1 hypothetical protein bpln_2g03220 [Burkholderia plantarii]